MMDYEIFKAVVQGKFLSYLPEEYKDAEVKIHPAKKVNRTLDALSVIKDDSRVFPSMYVDEMYEKYQACGNLEIVLQAAAWKYAQTADREKGRELEMDLGQFKDKVIMCLVNTEQNRELLEDVPNRAFQDLSVIYQWVIDSAPNAIDSIIVSNKLAEIAGMTEEQLFQCAVHNTRRISPVSITSVSDVLGRPLEGVDIPQEIREEMERACHVAENMWIIGNSRGVHGAVSMLYEENLHRLAEKIGDDLIILPSSIHEVIAIPAAMERGGMANLAEEVRSINMGELELEERLSNSVYHYDRTARKVTLAAESPEKRLDGKQAELPLIQEDKRQR